MGVHRRSATGAVARRAAAARRSSSGTVGGGGACRGRPAPLTRRSRRSRCRLRARRRRRSVACCASRCALGVSDPRRARRSRRGTIPDDDGRRTCWPLSQRRPGRPRRVLDPRDRARLICGVPWDVRAGAARSYLAIDDSSLITGVNAGDRRYRHATRTSRSRVDASKLDRARSLCHGLVVQSGETSTPSIMADVRVRRRDRGAEGNLPRLRRAALAASGPTVMSRVCSATLWSPTRSCVGSLDGCRPRAGARGHQLAGACSRRRGTSRSVIRATTAITRRTRSTSSWRSLEAAGADILFAAGQLRARLPRRALPVRQRAADLRRELAPGCDQRRGRRRPRAGASATPARGRGRLANRASPTCAATRTSRAPASTRTGRRDVAPRVRCSPAISRRC